MRKTVPAMVALMLAGTALTGCSSDDGGAAGSGSQTIEVTFKGGSVTPNGDRVKVDLGRPVVFAIHADKAGEIHLHSSPEQEFRYPAGTSTEKITIDKPGVVDVESHALDKTIVQLEVG